VASLVKVSEIISGVSEMISGVSFLQSQISIVDRVQKKLQLQLADHKCLHLTDVYIYIRIWKKMTSGFT